MADVDAEQVAVAKDLESALYEAIGTLGPDDRETLGAVLEGRRPSIHEATFRKRLERAMKRLRVAWSTRHGSD